MVRFLSNQNKAQPSLPQYGNEGFVGGKTVRQDDGWKKKMLPPELFDPSFGSVTLAIIFLLSIRFNNGFRSKRKNNTAVGVNKGCC